jgi:outer membrane immunogenic protein
VSASPSRPIYGRRSGEIPSCSNEHTFEPNRVCGGLAYGAANTAVTGTNLAVPCPFNNCFSGSTGTTAGWTAGGGAEYAFAPKWTAKIEYLYLDFGNHSFVMNDAVNIGAAVTASTHTTVNVVRGGLNYHF